VALGHRELVWRSRSSWVIRELRSRAVHQEKMFSVEEACFKLYTVVTALLSIFGGST
jgi:hypothetical protein